MSAPKRWLSDGGGATRGERDLLRLGAAHEPPASAKDAVWTALLAQLPPIPPGSSGGGGAGGAGGGKLAAGAAKAAGAAGASGSGGAAVAGAVGGGILKSALIGAGSALLLIATYAVVAPAQAPSLPAPIATTAPDPGARNAPPGPLGRSPASSPIARDPSGNEGPAASPDSVAPVGAPLPAASGEARVAPSSGHDSKGLVGSAGSAAAPADRETRLLEESRRLAEARDALRRGDASGALSLLSDLQRAVPGGILGQEREALAIEALAKSGRTSEARTRAQAFLQAYPQSPHAPHVEPFAR
ncbi:MAG: hypothetical protein ABJE95_17940 [Byssovorax sp.]